jgi:hypothetical protein
MLGHSIVTVLNIRSCSTRLGWKSRLGATFQIKFSYLSPE